MTTKEFIKELTIGYKIFFSACLLVITISSFNLLYGSDKKHGIRELVTYSRLNLKEGFYEYSNFNIVVTGFGFNDIAFYDKENNFIYKIGGGSSDGFSWLKYNKIVEMCKEVEFDTIKRRENETIK